MSITQINCKSALSPSKLPGLTYSLNPYHGCQHNCAYCYAPFVLHRLPRSTWGSHINIKRNLPTILAKELPKKKPGTVGIATVTDPYQPIEKTYKVTRYCLEQLLRYDFPISIQTKNHLVTRDSDILCKFTNAEIMVSIGTLNDTERQVLEPHSSSISERFNIIKHYQDKGIKTSVFFGPIYPSVSPQNISAILEKFRKQNVTDLMIDSFHLRKEVSTHLQRTLPTHGPITYQAITDATNTYAQLQKHMQHLASDYHITIRTAF